MAQPPRPPPRPSSHGTDAATLDPVQTAPISGAPGSPAGYPSPSFSSAAQSSPTSAVDTGRHSAQPASFTENSGSFSGPLPEDAKNDPHVGQVFGGKYLIERVLGEGGMGVVYRARHTAIGKKFAIKLLHGDAIKDPEVVERFKVEAQAASSIGNEHIIDITDFAELPDGATYFVMEMLDGRALTKLFEDLKRVPTQRLVRIAKQLAQGLGAAHQAGIVHRDLKPDNIFLVKRSGGETDFVKILDFGIAKVGQSTNKLTKAGAVFGTPHYMSPEQASGSPIDHRTDIYALGVILYEGAVGRVPFDADNFMGILTQHMYKAPVPPRAVPEAPADLPPGLEVIIMRCLRKKPEERYSSMEELEADLDRLARGEVPKAAQDMMALSAGYQSLAQSALNAHQMPTPIPGQPPMGEHKKRWPLYAAIGAIVSVVGIAVIALMGPGKTSANNSTPASADTTSKLETPKASNTLAATVSAPPSTTTMGTTAKKTKNILVDPNAPNATIYDGTKQVGEGVGAQTVELEEGTTKTLTVKAPGYKDATVKLDAKSPSKISVQMKSLPMAKPTHTGGGGGDIDNPWGKK
jgi:serine/threonine protein kinase